MIVDHDLSHKLWLFPWLQITKFSVIDDLIWVTKSMIWSEKLADHHFKIFLHNFSSFSDISSIFFSLSSDNGSILLKYVNTKLKNVPFYSFFSYWAWKEALIWLVFLTVIGDFFQIRSWSDLDHFVSHDLWSDRDHIFVRDRDRERSH